MDEPTLARFLEWDTQFFGARIASLQASELDGAHLERELEWCRANRIQCLYLRTDAADLVTRRAAEDRGFRLMDFRITLEAKLDAAGVRSDATEPRRLRPADARDVPALREIASVGHTDSRFYADPNFDRAACGELYATWIEKSVAGLADAVFVPELDGTAVGYITCSRRADDRAEIGLVGIAACAARRGLGRELVSRAFDWCREQNLARVSIATQARNVPALRLYERSGFETVSVELWHHLWLDAPVPTRR